MIDTYKGFEAELTRLTREAVFGSPALIEQYRRRHARNLWRVVAMGCVMVVGVPMFLALVLVVLPTVILTPALVLLTPDILASRESAISTENIVVLAAFSFAGAIPLGMRFARPNSLFCSRRELFSRRSTLSRIAGFCDGRSAVG
jgi:hypothetical protein